MNSLSKIIIASISVLSLMACNSRRGYNDYVSLPPDGWAYGDTIDFAPEIPDSVAVGELEVYLGHNSKYEYSNVWIEVCYNTASAQRRDTIELIVADDFGHWLGSGTGTTYQVSRKLSRPVILRNGSHVKIRHIMRLDTLRNIENIGLRIVNN